ncbi:MAG TPA: hypothetical protein VF039_06805 [Longimicrobiales bacterium]
MSKGYRGMRRALLCAAFGIGVLGASAAPAAGQFFSGDWGTTWVGVAETSGDDVTTLLASASLSPSGYGLKPVVGLQGMYFIFDDNNSWSVTPSAGVALRAETGAVQARVGYTFSEETDFIPFGGPDAGDDPGLSTSLQADYWDGGAYGLQGIASYNWGSEYLWTRARATLRVLELDPGSIHVGPEFVYQGEMGEEGVGDDPHYTGTQLGGILLWNSGNLLQAGFGAGIKNNDVEGIAEDDESTWYMKLEFVLRS